MAAEIGVGGAGHPLVGIFTGKFKRLARSDSTLAHALVQTAVRGNDIGRVNLANVNFLHR